MKIIIDVREHELYEKCVTQCQGLNVQIFKETLLIGDIVFKTEQDRDILIIERKTVDDLLASIKDGRYKEQSYRLQNCTQTTHHHHNIVYLIEGLLTKYPPATRKIVYGAITSLNYFKGYSVLRTWSVQETAEILLYMANKIDKEVAQHGNIPHYLLARFLGRGGGGGEEGGEGTEGGEGKGDTIAAAAVDTDAPPTAPPPIPPADYSSVVKKVKKDNVTPENIGQIMLSQIPGISSQTAIQIIGMFDGSLTRFIDGIRENPDCLNGLQIGTGEKKRKVNKSVIENIKLYFATPPLPQTAAV